MDILLSHSYFLSEDPHELKVMKPYPPLGLLYLASHLKRRGFSAEVFDSTFRDRPAFSEVLSRTRASAVGIYGNLITRAGVLDQIRVCKAKGCPVVLGGPEPAAYAEEYLARGADVVVVGEGELTLEDLLPRLSREGPHRLQDVAGIVFRDETGRIVRTPSRPFIKDLDSQPLPDRDAVDLPEYLHVWRRHHGMGPVSLIVSRGCPYTCRWCSHGVFGYSLRLRSPKNVADEVELVRDTYRPDFLWYADDVFGISRRWLFEYARELERRKLHLPFETISREDRLDEDVIRLLAKMGCFRLWIGSESGSQAVLDAMQRRTNAERVRQMVKLLQGHGIEAGLFLMLGYEGEKWEDIEATLEHLKKAAPDQFLTTVSYPIKGTPYHEQLAERIVQASPWEKLTDRDLEIAGRHSRRFYQFAIRRMVGEYTLQLQWRRRPRNYRKLLKALVNTGIGRLGMRLTHHEVTRRPAAGTSPLPETQAHG